MPARGCGDEREDDGLYVYIPMSENGRPIEDFIIDPARPWPAGFFRGVQPAVRKDGTVDVIIWIGEKYYASVSDYIEECRRFGLSRRIPKNFPVEDLTPGKSMMFLVHANAIPAFQHEVIPPTRRDGTLMCRRTEPHTCTFSDWPLSSLMPDTDVRKRIARFQKGGPPIYEIEMPGFSYNVTLPARPTVRDNHPYKPGIFAGFHLTTFHYVAKSETTKMKGRVMEQRIKRAGFKVEVTDE